jgi:hypothetical protein
LRQFHQRCQLVQAGVQGVKIGRHNPQFRRTWGDRGLIQVKQFRSTAERYLRKSTPSVAPSEDP